MSVAYGRRSASVWPAIACFLVALPHFAIPAGAPYRPPAASLFLAAWVFFALLRPRTIRIRTDDPGALRLLLICFFVYCLLSTAYGYWSMDNMNRLTLRLTTGDVEYIRIASERLLQLLLAILAFEIVRRSRFAPSQLMRWWLNGMVGAVVLHFFTYLVTDDPLMQRRGPFNEGNLAGLYYLLSIFIAFECRRNGPVRQGVWYVVLATFGVLLSRSTAAIVLLTLLFAAHYSLATPSPWKRMLRAVAMIVIVPLIGIGASTAGLDFGISEKLFEEDLTANSFSRIDRLESIAAAIRLFVDSPILGNGLQSYGFLCNDLLDGPLLAVYDESFRRIPNNIYAEIAAELGTVGLVLFGAFVVSLLRLSFRRGGNGQHNFLLGVSAVLLYWNAFPTYSVVFIWAFFGLAVAAHRSHAPNTHEPMLSAANTSAMSAARG